MTGADVVVSVLAVANLAIAGPVLDFLARNLDVFVARAAPRGDVIAVALVLTVVLPLALGAVVWCLRAVDRRLGSAVHAALLAAMLAVLAVRLLEQAPLLGRIPPLLVAAAVAVGAAGAGAYFRSAGLRSFLRLGVIAPIGFFALFAFLTPARDLIAPAHAEEARATVRNPVPVVLVLFDGLPAISLMDADERIDAELFPHFARLESESTWFRNATTHSASTRGALPGMFTGTHVRAGESAASGNLFELLPEEHRVVAYEPFIALCPEERCDAPLNGAHWRERWPRLARDVGLLSLHALTPEAFRGALPPAEDALGEFAGGRPDHDHDDDDGHHEAWDWFLDELRLDDPRGVHFFHWMKPHFPWYHLPSGQASSPPPNEPHGGYVFREWQDDWVTTAQWQRQLLQVGYVDLLLGELIEALERAGMYDDALVIVASDHGEAFTLGEPTRAPSPGNLGEIAYVTLFVKEPGQDEGRVVDAPVELVDVFPTIADVLDFDLREPVDGRSLLGELPAERLRTIEGWDFEGALDASGAERDAPLQRKIEHFGPEGGWERLFALGRHGDLAGSPLADLGVEEEPGARIAVQDLERLRAVDPDAERVPNLVMGRVRADRDIDEPMPLAVALNGRVVTVAETYGMDGPRGRFFAVLPADAFVAGENTLELFEVVEEGQARTLRRVRVDAAA